MKQTLAVDFDGVIHSYQHGDWEGIAVTRGAPMQGCKNAMTVLHQQYRLVIHTCRATHPDGVRAVRRYMEKHHIPFDEITDKKPAAVAYIDDRGFHFVDWPGVVASFSRG